jgi:hypothetical protein
MATLFPLQFEPTGSNAICLRALLNTMCFLMHLSTLEILAMTHDPPGGTFIDSNIIISDQSLSCKLPADSFREAQRSETTFGWRDNWSSG